MLKRAWVFLVGLATGCGGASPLLAPPPEALTAAVPDSFQVLLETSRGPVLVMARREWSPLGVDRFYYLVQSGYFDGTRFFRVVPGFVAQFGLSGDPRINAAWRGRSIPDEPVRQSNGRGRMSYARGGPDTRSVQLYINLADNPRLDTANAFGFPPIGEVVSGMEAVDSLYGGYGCARGSTLPCPSQDSIRVAGNRYLAREFPRLDWIRRARVTREWNTSRR